MTYRYPFLSGIGLLLSLPMNAQLSCSPIADLPMNGDAVDVSGNGYSGTMVGVTPTTDRFGMPGQALSFDGFNDRIDLPSDFDLPQRTWAFWFKAHVIDGSFNEIYDDDHNGIQNAQTELFFVEENGEKRLKMNMGSTMTSYSTPVNEDQWYHVAQVRSATEVRYYLNGCLVFTSPDLSNVHSLQGEPTVSLGTGRLHNNYYFDGCLDGLKIFDCALSDADVNELANGLCDPEGQHCGLMAHFNLDNDGSDASYNGYDATVYGTTPTTDHLGNTDAAMHFDGIDDRVDLPVDLDMPERTWAFWCKADVINGDVHEVYDNDHDALQNAQTELFFIEEGGVKKVRMNMGSTNTVYEQPIAEGTWNHFAQVRSNVDVRYYINGCLVFTSTDLSNVHSNNGLNTMTLGTGRTHDNYWFEGDLDDVRIYPCALSWQQIDELAGHSCAMDVAASPVITALTIIPLGNGLFQFTPAINGTYHVDVLDALGRTVFTGTRQGTARIDLGANASSLYMIRATAGGLTSVGRVLVD